MNSITTRRALTDKVRFAGRSWFYEFRELTKGFDEGKYARRAANLSTQFSGHLRNWSDESNSEWICRHYLAGKMILAATVQLTSRQYAREHNVRVVDAYLAYYALLSLSRAVVLTLPNVPWDEGRIIRLSHKKLRNLAVDAIRYFDARVSTEVQSLIDQARASRELISYWHPSSGHEGIRGNDRLIEVCTLLAEVAQFNSEILEACCHKRRKFGFRFLDSYVEGLSSIELHGNVFFDEEDAYRLDYLARKYPVPGNIKHILTEGHVDSFLIAWGDDEDRAGTYDPDENPWIIFDLN